MQVDGQAAGTASGDIDGQRCQDLPTTLRRPAAPADEGQQSPVQSFFTGSRRPAHAGRARWRPVAAAAPVYRPAHGGPPPLSAQSATSDPTGAKKATHPALRHTTRSTPPSEPARHRRPGACDQPPAQTQPKPRRLLQAAEHPMHRPPHRPQTAPTFSDGVAGAGGGTGGTRAPGRSTHPPSWLTFCG